MILFFSGCGNSRFVAEELAQKTNDRLCQIDPTEEKPCIELGNGEALGIVCPVYAWAIPRIVRDWLLRLSINNSPDYLYLACTCGDNVGMTPEQMDKELQKKGMHLDAAFSFVMPETYVNLKAFKLDTPENANRKIETVRKRLPLVAEKIIKREHVTDVVRGNMPKITTYLVNPLFYRLLITDRKFYAGQACINCGKCVQVCPLHNITMDEGHPRWNGNCTNCMACYHHCPTDAIQFGKATVGKGRYYFGMTSNSL